MPRRLLLAALLPLATAAQAPDRVRFETFSLDRTEITIAQLQAARPEFPTTAEREGGGFEYTAGWTRRPGWTWRTPYGQPGRADEPAVHLTWAEASEICAARGGRLPTAAEWRLAAYTEQRTSPPDGFQHGRTYPYPVGETPEGMNTNRRAHVPVGTTKAGVNGLYDMGANVWEWLADRRGEEALTAGGSWWYGPAQTRAEAMQWKPAGFHAVYIGFRCAYDVPR